MARRYADTAFINIPYDQRYRDLYLAFIAGLTTFGQTPEQRSKFLVALGALTESSN